ncbi:hypothetical protein ACFL5V_11785 [Fibrobacterota bacterium]
MNCSQPVISCSCLTVSLIFKVVQKAVNASGACEKSSVFTHELLHTTKYKLADVDKNDNIMHWNCSERVDQYLHETAPKKYESGSDEQWFKIQGITL